MAPTNATELMHTVLDGEADQAQVRELNDLLATDPSARAEFANLESLIKTLDGMPPHLPPDGLHASVLAAVDAAGPVRRQGRLQLFSLSRVFGSAPRVSGLRTSRRSNTFNWSQDMSKQTSSPFGNRKLWIGGATAAAALVVWQFGFEQWPMEKDVMGTIAPAERYRAAQPGAADIKVGAPTVAATSRDAKPPVEVVEKSSTQATSAERAKPNVVATDKSAPQATAADRFMQQSVAADKVNLQSATADKMNLQSAAADRTQLQSAAAERNTLQSIAADKAAAQKAVQNAADLAADKAPAARQK